ncbi:MULTISPECIES: ATP-binding protein [unclassified Allomuricauda]|uniref:ATP-binding protein n=1 Tax=unclassified Allomuricauda TaxID=2615049 RepID=UPI00273EB872|nr:MULTISPECIES: ATP-binding protein [unclassified Allomuricauda]
MERIRIKDVELSLSLHANECFIQESLSGEIQTKLVEELVKIDFFENLTITDIPSINTKQVTYKSPVPENEFPLRPTTDSEFGSFLQRAIRLTKSILEIHKLGHCFGVLRDDRFKVDKDGNLITLGIGLFQKEYVKNDLSKYQEEDFYFLAPEFSKRSNLKPNQRSDIYGLGILLHYWLIGEHFIKAIDKQEVLHKHLTEPYQEVTMETQWKHTGIHQIINGLLEKKPENRYQSIDGVLKDLLELKSQFHLGDFSGFSVRSMDYTPGIINMSDKLLEREDALKKLMDTYYGVRKGDFVVSFIEGSGGIGKTSLGKAFESAITEPDVLFSMGAFDKTQPTPYRAFQEGFKNIAQRILLKSGKSHAEIRDIFVSGLGADFSALFKVVPDLKDITGNLPEPETLDPLETGDRFVNLFARYCRTLDSIGLKRVLFIDDAQWCDISSLKVIEHLVNSSISRVMFVLSYNPDGMTEEHPLRKFQRSLWKRKKNTPIIHLQPLSEDATERIVSDALSEEGKKTKDLASLIHKKTNGNPYYIKHFLHAIYEDKVISYDHHAQRWQCSMELVKKQEVAENVLAIYEKKLLLQSYQAQVLLKVAAYDNGNFNIPLLAFVCDYPDTIVGLLLELLSDAGQISKLDLPDASFVFNHNQIKQAALKLTIPGFEVLPEKLHYKIAQFRLERGNIQSSTEFNQLVEHLIEARNLIDEEMVVQALFHILQAGQLANNSNSPSIALQYLTFALELQDRFKTEMYRYEVLFDLAKASYLLKDMDEGKSFSKRAIAYASNIQECSEVSLLNMKFFEAYSLFEENIDEGLMALENLGVPLKFSGNLEEIHQKYELFCSSLPKDLKRHIKIKNTQSRSDGQTVDIMVNMCTSAHRTDQNLYMYLLLKLGRLMFDNGFTEASPFILVHLGSLLCHKFSAFETGRELVLLAMELLDSSESDKYYSKTLSVYHILMAPFIDSYKTLESELDSSIAYCIDRGDAFGANNLLYAKIRNQLVSGVELTEFLRYCNDVLQPGQLHDNNVFEAQVNLMKSIAYRLRGDCPEDIDRIDQDALCLLEESNCKASKASYHILRGWVYCIQGKYNKTLKYFAQHKKDLHYSNSEPQYFRYQIINSICDLMVQKNPVAEVFERVRERQKVLKDWARISPENFKAEFEMVELILACKTKCFENIPVRIEETLRWAEKGKLNSVRGMVANVLQRTLPKESFGFLIESLENDRNRTYNAWGVKDSGTKNSLKFDDVPENYVNKFKGFDFQSLIKATQAISAEVNRDRLVESLLQIVMENAGADKGALVLSNGSELNVAAYIDLTISADEQFSECSLNKFPLLPINLIEHVALNKRELCIDDLTEYSSNLENSPSDTSGSLLLMPLIKQGDLVGVLYVANSQMTGMFTEGGLEVFRIIASQAAISITNSILYEQAITLNDELASSQKELAKLNQALEEKIKDRTQHLRHEIEMRKEAERDLIFAKNDADNANKAKSQFLANMSHEIRTPLNAIVGFSQILTNQSKDLNLTNSFRRYLSNIYQSAESLSEIIRDILDLSKIEAGKTALLVEDMDLRQLFFSVYRIQNSLAKSKDVKVAYSLCSGTPRYVRSDRGKIKQILMNIVGNAVKFTPASRSVHFDLCVNDGHMVFTVSDEGIGIPTTDLERIFEPFTQSDAGMDRKYGGTGLGLAITKSLVDILKGEVHVESDEGKGTCFTIKIPYQKAAPMQSNNTEALLANYRIPLNSKILVVEDHPMNQEMIRALFSELGAEILLASDGKEGLSLAKRYHPDIIFMDIHMPEIDGFGTLKLIRESNLDVPVIGLSADAFKEHQEAAIKAGFSAYLTKPVQVPKLVGLLKRFLPDTAVNRIETSRTLDERELYQKNHALETIRKLPIFETEKLAKVAATLSNILPSAAMDKLEDAIYTGDEEALQEFLTDALNV